MSQLLQFYKSFQQARAPVAKAAPTFEDLTIDDRLTEHQRVVRYTKSSIGLQRCATTILRAILQLLSLLTVSLWMYYVFFLPFFTSFITMWLLHVHMLNCA